MHLGLFILGAGSHIAGWRWPGAVTDFSDLAAIQQVARTAERGRFDLIFMGDNLYADPGAHPSYTLRLEPLTMMAALATTTRRVGFGATASTTYGDPWSTARAFASLDHISGGRAAWNAVTTTNPAAGANFDKQLPGHAERYERAEEFIEVVLKLWDAWDDDALAADRATGVYLDPKKLRAIDHVGRHFKVKGPVNIGRAPQGRPIVLQAGGSVPGQALAARTADVVFTVTQDIEESQAAYKAVKERMPAFGRSPEQLTMLPGVMPVVGRTDKEAREKLAVLQSFVDSHNGLQLLTDRLGFDMTQYDFDGPVPELPQTEFSQTFARVLLDKARRDGLTLRDLYNLNAAARGHWVLCGSPVTTADTLEHWFTERAADGFNVMPPWFHENFDDFVDMVVPILQERGLFRRDYEGMTLRDHLGLTRPERLARSCP
jgi:FMN-dependent oxidoreductase (nitrilotriacetate monooxygenase family)